MLLQLLENGRMLLLLRAYGLLKPNSGYLKGNSLIVVISAVKESQYDSYKLGYEPIKFGRIV